MKTTFARDGQGKWFIKEDCVNIRDVNHFAAEDNITGCVGVVHEGEWQVDGRAYNAMVALPAEETSILKCKQREFVDHAIDEVTYADKVMWTSIHRRQPVLPSGCKTLLLELFCGGYDERGCNTSNEQDISNLTTN